MADKVKPNGQPLPRPAALRGADVTRVDVARALAKWTKRVPGLEKRLREAANA